MGDFLITGRIREVSTLGGTYPLPAAAGAAGNPKNNLRTFIERDHRFHEVTVRIKRLRQVC